MSDRNETMARFTTNSVTRLHLLQTVKTRTNHIHVDLESGDEHLHALEASHLQFLIGRIERLVEDVENFLPHWDDVVTCCESLEGRLTQGYQVAHRLVAW